MTNPTSLVVTAVILAVALFHVLQECTFLIPHRQEIVNRYGAPWPPSALSSSSTSGWRCI